MKFTLNWLKEYLDTDVSIEEILNKLDQIGLEVEEYIDNGASLKDFNVVEIVECENHPDSDHLHICKVKTVKNEILEIVCGAPNARKNLKTILAPIGVKMPNSDIVISRSKIRGVYSNGMLCSEKELGIGDDHKGIIEINNSIDIGTNIAKILNIDDIIIDINITPNRGDCLGVYGIARDLSASGIGKLKPFKNFETKSSIECPIKCKITDENCSEFSYRYIKNVKNCESPEWMKKRLSSIGINPKSALVDITNYVMFTLNRPLHCYDADLIKGDFLIQKSKGGEKFSALNNKEYELCEDSTLICDTSNNVLGLGGIIGGLSTAVSENTKNIVLECAYFNPISIATTARKMNINTDAKYRFERNVDRLSTELVMNYTTYLINTICGGENSDIKSEKLNNFNKRLLNFNMNDIKRVLGINIEKNIVFKILNDLGYEIVNNNDNIIELVIPSWRNDIIIAENIIEDIIRIYGYDNIEETQIDNKKSIETENNTLNKFFQNKLWEISSYLASKGMFEVITWSFMDEKIASEFFPIIDSLKVVNPIISDLSYMRPTIIPNLMKVAKYNQDRSIDSINIFECGNIFFGPEEQEQKKVISGIKCGLTCKKSIFNDSRLFDIYDVKQDIFDILNIYGISSDSLIITKDVPNYYHPSRSGAIKLGNTILGVFGEINPLKTKFFDIKYKVNAFELYIDFISKFKTKISKTTQKKKFIINDLQPVYRDFAFIIDSNIEMQDIIFTIKKTNKDLITDIHIFDIYTGKGIKDNKKSIAFSIKIQPQNKSLTTEEINVISKKIIDELSNKFNAILRDEKL